VSTKASIDAISISVPVVGPIAGTIAKPILKELVDIVFEQTSSIDQKLDKQIEAHYKVGIKALRDAGNVDDQMRKSLLEDARHAFAYASESEIKVVRQAQAMFYSGVCYTLLGQHDAALDWYRDAYQKGQEHLAVLRQQVNAETVGYSRVNSIEAKASAFDNVASNVSPSLINMAMRSTLKAGPYGAVLALLVGGAGYATLGAIKGGKAIASTIGDNKARNMNRYELDLATFNEQFLNPLEQLLRPGG
jgi:hypothetical protein